MQNRSNGDEQSQPFFWLSRSAAYLVLLAGLVFTLLPFVYILLASFKTNAELLRVPPTFFPERPIIENYTTVLADRQISLGRIFFNSGLVAIARTVLTLFISSFAGYIFARYRFTGKNLFFGMILAQLMIPFQVVMIPLYLLTVRMGLVDTLWALVVPMLIDAYGIFVAKQFVEGLPGEVLAAARIDGASEFGIYWRIVLPQLVPGAGFFGNFYLYGVLERLSLAADCHHFAGKAHHSPAACLVLYLPAARTRGWSWRRPF